jgi:hypothetical protein
MTVPFRQSMAWLHTWSGLWLCWLLYAIFLTGTLAIFDEPITHWMTPEHHVAAAQSKAPAVTDRGRRLDLAVDYLARHKPGIGMWEIWPINHNRDNALVAYSMGDYGDYADTVLDPVTGAPVPEDDRPAVRETLGGHHFVNFHYTLHAGLIGQWITAIAAMVMLVALTSGVITHKRIFKDFFTFRAGKGQRSWLDAHNAVAVLTLPFQFMIAFTGIVLLWSTYMPAALVANYGASKDAYAKFAGEFYNEAHPTRTGPMRLPPLEPFAAKAERLMGQDVRAVVIYNPGDRSARIKVYGWNPDDALETRLANTSGMVEFEAASGRVLCVRELGGTDGDPAAVAEMVVWALHMATGGGTPMRWLYFLCGAAGTAMMATASILFMVKRRQKAGNEFGRATQRLYRVIEALNVGTIAGLGIASIGYLWANRLIPADLAEREAWEVRAFFALWVAAMVHAALRPARRGWIEQFALLVVLGLGLPILNLITIGDHPFVELMRGDLESFGVESMAMVLGICTAWAAWRLHRKNDAAPRRRSRRPQAMPFRAAE